MYDFIPPELDTVYSLIGHEVDITLPNGEVYSGRLKRIRPSGAFCVIKPARAPRLEVPLVGARVQESR